MSANDKQVGGDHYRTAIQHWDFAWANEFDVYQYITTKYITRWKKKGGIEDLRKAQHALEKYIEVIELDEARKAMAGCGYKPDSNYTNQDR